ncbi:hypothetical protein MTO96_040622 [Rhipicephalus appendiculatus]
MPRRNDEKTRQCMEASHGNAKAAADLCARDELATPAAAGGITKGDARHSKRPCGFLAHVGYEASSASL